MSTLSFSQPLKKNTEIQQTVDSLVQVNIRDVIAANKIRVEWRGYRGALYYKQLELSKRERQIQDLQRAYDKINKSDSIAKFVTIPDLEKMDSLNRVNFSAMKDKFKMANGAKIGLAITTPIVAVLSFVLGWYLHR